MSESDLVFVLILVAGLWAALSFWGRPREQGQFACRNGVIGCQGWGAGKPEPCEQCHYDSFV